MKDKLTNRYIKIAAKFKANQSRNILTIFAASFILVSPLSAQEAEVNLSSTVIGNQEQPKVLYIVPWKAVGESELEDQTVESQLDIVFAHVERVELRRELKFIEQLAKNDKKQNNEED